MITRGTITFLIALGSAWAAHPKISKDLENAIPDSMVNVIVQFRHAPTEGHHAKVVSSGGQLQSALHLVKGGAYTVPASALEDLANDPEVAYISPDRAVHGALDYSGPTVGANIAHSYGLDGTGIGIAVIDSGVTNHPDLMNAKGDKSCIVYSQSFIGGGNDDHYGHGTHVAGVLGGNGRSTTGSQYTHAFTGMAPNVNIVNLRALDSNGEGLDSNVIAAIQTAIQLKNTYNIRVINLSLGRPVFESFAKNPLCQAVEAAWQAGIVVVVAAGNDGRNNSVGNQGYGTISAPGNDPFVITVGAMKTNGTISRSDDTIASYSAKGPTAVDHIVKPDIVAPGNRMISLLASTAQLQHMYPSTTIPVNYYGVNSSATSNSYFRLSGTSLATPMVAGAVLNVVPCTLANPIVTLSPASASVNFSAAAKFTVSVLNNNSATCASATFTLAATSVTGLTASLSATSVALASGASGTATLTETAGTTAGTYSPSVKVTNYSNSSYSSTATASLTVVATTVKVTTDSSTYKRLSAVTMTAPVAGATPIGSASVTFTLKRPSGTSTTYTATANASGLATWKYTLSSTDPNGTYTMSAKATVNSVKYASAPVTFAVSP